MFRNMYINVLACVMDFEGHTYHLIFCDVFSRTTSTSMFSML